MTELNKLEINKLLESEGAKIVSQTEDIVVIEESYDYEQALVFTITKGSFQVQEFDDSGLNFDKTYKDYEEFVASGQTFC